MGRPTRLGEHVPSVSHFASGHVASVVYGSGVRLDYEETVRGLPARLRLRSGGSPGATVWLDLRYGYDAQGNINHTGSHHLTFDLVPRLRRVGSTSGAADVASHAYDALGLRARESVAAGTTDFFVTRDGLMLGEYEAGGNRHREHIHLHRQRVATVTGGGGVAGAAFDIDGNGRIEAEHDALLLARHRAGLRGAALVAGALGAGATRSTAGAIDAHIAAAAALDIDGDGAVDLTRDALVIARYARGVRGAALVSGVGFAGPRGGAAAVETAASIATNTPGSISGAASAAGVAGRGVSLLAQTTTAHFSYALVPICRVAGTFITVFPKSMRS